MRMNKLFWTALVAGGLMVSAVADNLVRNSDFEQWGPVPDKAPAGVKFLNGQMPTNWQFTVNGATGAEAVVISSEPLPGEDTERALKIEKLEKDATFELLQWYFPVKPETTYEFSFKLKTVDLALTPNQRMMFACMAGTAQNFWQDKTGTFGLVTQPVPEWTEVKQQTRTKAGATQAMIRMSIPKGVTGTVLVTDFELEEQD